VAHLACRKKLTSYDCHVHPELRDLLSGKPVYRKEDINEAEEDGFQAGDESSDPPRTKASKKKKGKKEDPPKVNAQKSSMGSTPKGRPSELEGEPGSEPLPVQRLPTATLEDQARAAKLNLHDDSAEGGRAPSAPVLSEAASWPAEIEGALPGVPPTVQGCVGVERSNCLSEIIAYDSASEADVEYGKMEVDGPIPGDDAERGFPATGTLPGSGFPVHCMCGEISYLFRGRLFFSE
jgi:hypothetical protein